MTKNKIESCITTVFLMIIFLTVSSNNSSKADVQHGIASYYKKPQLIACGVKNGKSKKFKPHEISAAHKTLPCGTKVKVTRKDTGKSIVVRINDRGPYIDGRIIDLSFGAAKELGMLIDGIVPVKLTKL